MLVKFTSDCKQLFEMTQVLLGKEVPSLKITLENDGESDLVDFEEGEISEPENVDETNDKQVILTRVFSDPFKGVKVYKNKGGAFVTGLDLSSEPLLKKLEGRASRFGLQKEPENKVTQQDIDALYESMGIDLDALKIPSKVKNYRIDTIHMRGVDEMNTNEIFHYFNEYGPASVEWINDSSCNVVWLDETSAARALLQMSQVFVPKKKSEVTEDIKDTDASLPDEIVTTIKNSELVTDISFSDDSTDEEDDTARAKEKSLAKDSTCIAMDVDEPQDETPSETIPVAQETTSVEVPIPPGHWRIGTPHPKAKTILLRFATKDDKKIRGAEKRSQFYQKYGNPNYGGLKGLISNSRKRKIMATRTKQIIEDMKDETSHPVVHLNAGIGSGDEAPSVVRSKQSRSKIRMRMYADDEEEKQERKAQAKRFKSEEAATSRKGNVHSRLGKKFTTTELRSYQDYSPQSDEESELQITREITAPSRYSVWTSLAKSMADEESQSRTQKHDSKTSEDLRDSLSSSRMNTKDLRDSLSSSRISSDDLRASLSSSRISSYVSRPEPRLPRPNKDLRSRIKQIREDNFPSSKHRSPLLVPDERSDSD